MKNWGMNIEIIIVKIITIKFKDSNVLYESKAVVFDMFNKITTIKFKDINGLYESKAMVFDMFNIFFNKRK